MFTDMMPHQPLAAFAGFACSLQFEWAYLQRAVESAINEKLLSALFGGPVIPTDLHTLTSLPRAEEALNQSLLVVTCTANNMVLNKDEFCDQHSLQHALQCKIEGLIGGQHDKVQDDFGLVGSQAISPNAVCDVPRVQTSWDSQRKGGVHVDYQGQYNKNNNVCIIKKKEKDKDNT
eukprot:5818788-Ditylum_brightwellii.AAC.1